MHSSALLLLVCCSTAGVAAVASCGDPIDPVPALCTQTSAPQLFERRIAPLLADDRPKSCNQCHLSGVDLGAFVRSSPCETLVCLEEDELISRRSPEESTLLSWIDRADPESPLITEAVIAEEREAVLQWLEHYATCGKYQCEGVACERGESEPFCELEDEPRESGAAQADPGGCSELALESVFRSSVYASRGRCFPCHFESEPQAAPTASRFIDETGNCEQASLTSMRRVLRAGLVNVQEPAQSLLMTKPLAEEDGGVWHGGHDKFFIGGDPALENFQYWIDRVATCTAAEL